MFTIRRMTPADKPAIQEIASRIWDGQDYLPSVFDEWVNDGRGAFVAAVLDGIVVGCGKLTMLTDADAWVEGLRKDPRVREKGLGRAVVSHLLALCARRRDLRSVRFATDVDNRQSIVTNERLGFRARALLSRKLWEGTQAELAARGPGNPAPGRPAVRIVDDGRLVADFLDRSRYFESTRGLVVEGWHALPYSRRLIEERYVRPGACRGILSGGRLAGLCIRVMGNRAGMTIVRLVCVDSGDDEIAAALLDDAFAALHGEAVRSAAVDGRHFRVEWMVPAVERCRRWCAAAGLMSEEHEDDFIVYELPLETLEMFADRAGEDRQ